MDYRQKQMSLRKKHVTTWQCPACGNTQDKRGRPRVGQTRRIICTGCWVAHDHKWITYRQKTPDGSHEWLLRHRHTALSTRTDKLVWNNDPSKLEKKPFL